MNRITANLKRLFAKDSKEVIKEDISYISLQNRLNALEQRISSLELRNSELGFDQLGGRIDYRLTRLELLQYYANSKHYESLDAEQKEILNHLEEKQLQSLPRKFPVFRNTEPVSKPSNITIKQDGNLYYWELSGKKIYMAGNYNSAQRMANNLYSEFFTNHPHRYLEPQKDGIDVPEGAILADIGAAEGLFAMLYIERCKKVYLFESDPHWIKLLKKTYAPYMEKVEIVQGTVGIGLNDIKLDEFFKGKEPPTFVKMDVEGYEPSVTQSMGGIIRASFPLTMLICTYHRQSDWEYFSELLQDTFDITSSPGYFWHMPDPCPPFFRHGVMRAVKRIHK